MKYGVALKSKKSLLQDISSVFGTKVFVLLISIISIILLARVLGSDGRGLLAAALIYPQLLLSFSEGGMRQAAVLFIGKEKAKQSEVVGALFSYIIVAGCLGFLLTFTLMLYLGDESFGLGLILAASLLLPFTLSVNALQGIFLGEQNLKSYNKVLWLQKLIYVFILVLLFLSDNLSVMTAVLTTTFSAFLNSSYTVWLLWINKKLDLEWRFSTLRSMFRVGITYALALFLIQANYKIDILLMSWLSTSEELGNYSVATQLGELVWQLPSAVLLVIMSRTANSRGDDIVNTVVISTRLTLFVTLILTILLVITSTFLVIPVFGSDYGLVYKLLIYMSPGLVFASLFKTLNAYFAGEGKTSIAIKVMSITVFINIVGNYFLIPAYGAIGAAISTSISYFVSGFIIVLIFSKSKNISIFDIIFIKSTDFKLRRNKNENKAI